MPLTTEAAPAAQAWPSRVAAERGIRRVLRTYRADVLHLRMAEVGSLAAAEVARELGIPVVFTLAPDPHAVIHALDMTGALRRGNFGTEDDESTTGSVPAWCNDWPRTRPTSFSSPVPTCSTTCASCSASMWPSSPAASPSCRRAST